jgi:hypothetical protein
MIELIINELLNNEDVVQKYNLNRSTISYIPTSKSPYRNYLRSRFSYIILSGASPALCVRFYNDKNSNALLEREYDIQRTIYTKYKNLKIPHPVALFEINGCKVMVEEAFLGKTLYKKWEENRATNNCHAVIEHATQVQMRLNENLIRSNFTALANEIHELTSQFIALYRPTPTEQASIMKLVNLLIDEFRNKSIYKRYTNGDFNPKNILLDVENAPILLDFERAEETQLYFLDWFKFICYFTIPRKTIEAVLNSNCDTTFVNALSYIKNLNYVSNNQIVKAQWLLFYMKEFLRQSLAYPKLEPEILRITMKSKLKTLFTGSNTRTDELVRLARISLFILKTGGVKILYHAMIDKIRTTGLLRPLQATQ